MVINKIVNVLELKKDKQQFSRTVSIVLSIFLSLWLEDRNQRSVLQPKKILPGKEISLG